jgi:type II secretory pathway component PulK
VDLTNLFQLLLDRYNDPLDLNRADAQELSALAPAERCTGERAPRSYPPQRRLLSLYELQTINGWDAATINLIRPFVAVRESPYRVPRLVQGDHQAGRP